MKHLKVIALSTVFLFGSWTPVFSQEDLDLRTVETVEPDPYEGDMNTVMAELFNLYGDYSSALDYALSALQNDNTDANAYLQAAIAYRKLYQNSEALEMLQKAEKLAKKDKELLGEIYSEMSYNYEAVGDYKKAVEALDKGIKADKKNTDLLFQRAFLIKDTDRKKAEKDVDTAKKLDPDNGNVYLLSALYYGGGDDMAKAMDEINKAIALDASEGDYYYIRGLFERKAGNEEAAISDFIHGVAKVENLSKRAFIELLGEDSPYTRNYILTQIESIPDKTSTIYDIETSLLLEWDMYQEAEEVFLDQISSGEADASTYYSLGKCQEETKNLWEAYETVRKGLELYPENTDLLFYLAQIYNQLGKFEEAEMIADSLIEDNPKTAAGYALKGKTLMNSGKFDQAIPFLTEAVELDDLPETRLALQFAYKFTDDTKGLAENSYAILNYDRDALIENGYNVGFYNAVGYAGLGRIADAKNMLQDEGVSLEAVIYVLTGEEEKALSLIESYPDEISESDFLFSYYFLPLHKNPRYSALIKERGLSGKFDPETGLYIMSINPFEGSEGTPYDEAMKALSSNPKDWEKAFNSLCPIDLGPTGQIISVKADEKKKKLVLNFKINQEVFDVNIFKQYPELDALQADISGMDMIYKNPYIVSLGASFEWNYLDSDNNILHTRRLPAKRLKELADRRISQKDIDQGRIEYFLKLSNINSKTTGNSMELRDNNVCLTEILTPDDEMNLSFIEIYKDEIRDILKSFFTIPAEKPYWEAMVRLGYGFKDIIVDPLTGKSIELYFSPDEIANIIGYKRSNFSIQRPHLNSDVENWQFEIPTLGR